MCTISEKLIDLGYDDFFDTRRKEMRLTNYSIGRVIAEYKEAYRVKGEGNEYFAKITGKRMFSALTREDYPAVGDWVAFEALPEEKAIIRCILPRKTVVKKKYSDKQEIQIIATNIDIAFITESTDRDYNLNRIERYIILANEGKIKPVIILNKIDLISHNALDLRIRQLKNRFKEVDIIVTSSISDQGLENLFGYIRKGKTYCFLGSSGVGKSTLINRLLGKDEIRTNEISASLGKGKHTTTIREMYFLKNGGIVIDNPGTREVGIADSNKGFKNIFDEISELSLSCKFSNCSHTCEPGCAVLQAVEKHILDEDKYANYIKLKKETNYYEMTVVEKREKDRKFGKFVKKALMELKH